jgi:uncharacterized protein YggT (Ycf19 family)
MGLIGFTALVNLIFGMLLMIVLAGVVLSWVELGLRRASWLYSPPINFIRELSFQIIRPFRNLMDRLGIPTRPLDFSPVIAMVAIQLIQQVVNLLLSRIGAG